MNRFCLFLIEKGKVYACGSNSFGQLGFSKNVSHSHPRLVKSLEEKNVSHIACGDAFTVAVTAGSFEYIILKCQVVLIVLALPTQFLTKGMQFVTKANFQCMPV